MMSPGPQIAGTKTLSKNRFTRSRTQVLHSQAGRHMHTHSHTHTHPHTHTTWFVVSLMVPQQLSSESTEGGGHHCVGRERIPIRDGAGEEREFAIVGSAKDPLVLLWVLLAGVVEGGAWGYWLEVGTVDDGGAFMDLVQHGKTSVSAADFKAWPLKLLQHLSHTGGVVVTVSCRRIGLHASGPFPGCQFPSGCAGPRQSSHTPW